MKTKRTLMIAGVAVAAVVFLFGCATLERTEYERYNLRSGSGAYIISDQYIPSLSGGYYLYSAQFMYTSSGFFTTNYFGSQTYTIQKKVAKGEGMYLLALDLLGNESLHADSIILTADSTSTTLVDQNPATITFPTGPIRFEEKLSFGLSPSLVQTLRNAKEIKFELFSQVIHLTAREQDILQSFLVETEGFSYSNNP